MAIKIENLSFSYPGDRGALKNIGLSIKAGKKTAILGANGSGKSTLLYHLNGIFLPQSGSVEILGTQLTKKTVKAIRRQVGFLFDYPDHQLFSTTVYQDIKFGLDNYRFPEGEKKERILQVAQELDITTLLDYPPHRLSLGQKKKVAIAGLIVLEPRIIICDEPFSGLDGGGMEDFKHLLEAWIEAGKTIVFSTHDVDLTYEWADEVVILAEGKVLGKGVVDEVLTSHAIYEQAGLNKPLLYDLFAGQAIKPRNVQAARQFLEELSRRQ